MQKQYKPLDFSAVSSYPIASRDNKVNIEEHFSGEISAGLTLREFATRLPRLLAAESLLAVADLIVAARLKQRPVILAIGGHVIKCGLQPVIKGLIRAGAISAVAMNGSAAIHDFEVSLIGATSEDVGAVLHAGDFGFSAETGQGMNLALREAQPRGVGFGQAIGEYILAAGHPHAEHSLLACCAENKIPATVHVALGTDIIHQHPQADGGVTGEMSYRDFKLLAAVIADLGEGGLWLNVGSAVLLPEVFLKALSVAQNLGHRVNNFSTANFDMIQHYRPLQNVIKRPTSGGGKGYTITGHHEINIPLLAALVHEGLAAAGLQGEQI